MVDVKSVLDARGLNCPIPILRAKKAIVGMNSGEVLKVIATDPGSVKDFDVFCRQYGHKLISKSEEDSEFVYLIEAK